MNMEEDADVGKYEKRISVDRPKKVVPNKSRASQLLSLDS